MKNKIKNQHKNKCIMEFAVKIIHEIGNLKYDEIKMV